MVRQDPPEPYCRATIYPQEALHSFTTAAPPGHDMEWNHHAQPSGINIEEGDEQNFDCKAKIIKEDSQTHHKYVLTLHSFCLIIYVFKGVYILKNLSNSASWIQLVKQQHKLSEAKTVKALDYQSLLKTFLFHERTKVNQIFHYNVLS